MNELPTLETERLILRPFGPDDASRVEELAGNRAVAEKTSNIPHPYPEGAAEEWIGRHREAYQKEQDLTLAVTRRKQPEVIGSVHLNLNLPHLAAELGYWIGVPYWNRGYATEAAAELIRCGFEDLDLNRIQALHMHSNPASGRVLEKLGMQREGLLRQAVLRFNQFHDYVMLAILAEEYHSLKVFPLSVES